MDDIFRNDACKDIQSLHIEISEIKYILLDPSCFKLVYGMIWSLPSKMRAIRIKLETITKRKWKEDVPDAECDLSYYVIYRLSELMTQSVSKFDLKELLIRTEKPSGCDNTEEKKMLLYKLNDIDEVLNNYLIKI